MLCGVSVVFNSLGNVLGLMSCKRSSENGQVLVGFQSTEAFGCLHHAGGGPAQRHRGISPSVCTENSILAASMARWLKFGFEVAQSSVAKYMVKRCRPPSQGWKLLRERQLSILDRRQGHQ
jgi:hypothetical protein